MTKAVDLCRDPENRRHRAIEPMRHAAHFESCLNRVKNLLLGGALYDNAPEDSSMTRRLRGVEQAKGKKLL